MIGEFIQEHMKLVLFIICVLFTILGAIGTDKAFKRKDCISYVCAGLIATFASVGVIMIILVTIADAIW
jgi:asparagine N-glycosylation enzyme membrane subunit Stt3